MSPGVKVSLCTCWISKVWPFFHSSTIYFTQWLPLSFSFFMAFPLSGANEKYTPPARIQEDMEIPGSLALLASVLLRDTQSTKISQFHSSCNKIGCLFSWPDLRWLLFQKTNNHRTGPLLCKDEFDVSRYHSEIPGMPLFFSVIANIDLRF